MADPQPPKLPEGAPKELVDFVECTGASVTLGGKIPWLPLPDWAPEPDVTIKPGATPGSATISIDLKLQTIELPASVDANGELSIDTTSMPFGKDTVDQWVHDLNA